MGYLCLAPLNFNWRKIVKISQLILNVISGELFSLKCLLCN
jgi:hypothetical protein